ncbi:hypothetical protein R6Q57_003655 [Mikania cordata]
MDNQCNKEIVNDEYSSQPVKKTSSWMLHSATLHIEGWVGRMMQWRHRQQQTEGASQMHWSILPPRFFDYLVDSNTKNTVKFANGKLSPYPSFFDVDYVYFPFCVENHEWLLVQVDL